jgi:hypothetical protein
MISTMQCGKHYSKRSESNKIGWTRRHTIYVQTKMGVTLRYVGPTCETLAQSTEYDMYRDKNQTTETREITRTCDTFDLPLDS